MWCPMISSNKCSLFLIKIKMDLLIVMNFNFVGINGLKRWEKLDIISLIDLKLTTKCKEKKKLKNLLYLKQNQFTNIDKINSSMQIVRPVNAFLVIDVQNDFISGSLNISNCSAQHNGHEVIYFYCKIIIFIKYCFPKKNNKFSFPIHRSLIQ